MTQVMEIFKELCKIEHGSGNTEQMRIYLTRKAEAYGYTVSTDEIGNILCVKTGSRVTLQSHYDMVSIGKTHPMQLQEREGWLSAVESTLGADNGIGMAIMLALMEEGVKVDALFTAEEEVGLIGARALELDVKTPYLLNLDSEEEGIVTIGCAGGVDITARLPLSFESQERFCFDVEIEGLPGGHSGVDIDKNIPNAIKELAKLLTDENVELVAINGGERRNAIAKHACAVVASKDAGCGVDGAKALGKRSARVIRESGKIVQMLHGFEHGVRAYDDELGIVKSSVNLAIVETETEYMTVRLSIRSMQRDLLEEMEAECVAYFKSFGCMVETGGFYPPWRPDQSIFAKRVLEISSKHFEEAGFGAIHAGLECGIIKEKFPDVDMASIGPNILYPHSTRETVEIASVGRVFEVVRRVVFEV